jgi:hypothetical protein
MKITYYSIESYGYGSIHEQTINTDEARCICFDNKTVTISETYEDWSGSEHVSNNTYFRAFEDARDQLLESHKKMVVDLQKQVRLLESAVSYEDYRTKYHKNL